MSPGGDAAPRDAWPEPCAASGDATVLLIDDDPDVREATSRLLRSNGMQARVFASAQEFQAQLPFTGLGCLILDVSMPGMTGPELHRWMQQNDCQLPVIYLSGRCDIPTSVQAMKRGALDVLEKPVDDLVLLAAIEGAIERHRVLIERQGVVQDVKARLASLSVREREVMDHVVRGRLNKQIASDLGIALKTVKVHRGRAMAKMRVRSVAELVHLCELIDRPA